MRRSIKPRSGANPLAVSKSFRAFVLDQLEELCGVVPRSMFGGVGLYRDGLFFGILAGDVLYFKVDDITRAEFEAAGSQPFKPYPDRAGTMQYYSVPVGVLESPSELARWGRQAVAVAARAAAGKAKPARTRKKSG
jgi:DNA transformation protein and related proteins